MRSASSWSSVQPLALASAADRSMAAINCDHASRLPTPPEHGNRLFTSANHAVVFACSPAASTAGPEVALERYHPLPHAQPSADAMRACVEDGSLGHPGCASSVAEPLDFIFSSSFAHGMSTSIRARNCSLIPTHRWVQWGAFSEMLQGLLMGKGRLS